MATVMEQEVPTADATPSVHAYYREGLALEEDARSEGRTDLTIEEAEELAQGQPFELIDGRMVFKMADRKHSRSQRALIVKLSDYFEQNPIGEVFPEFSLHLWPESKHNFRVPDIAVFLNENLHEEERYETRGPDLSIEIASDDDKASDLFAKARLYLEKGSRVVWVVFPTEKRVTVITPAEWRWESDTLTCPELLPGFSIAVEKISSSPARQAS
ncbi:Uma2 family endonuclease [candidate division KSB1 bacterium]|nr:Uma2 family endonuclease [candidate division KSB1 bacterium]